MERPRIHFEAYGCTMNQGEARMVSEHMVEQGYAQARSAEDADILVLVTCTVIGTTERKMLRRLRILGDYNKPLVVTGCMAEVQKDTIKDAVPKSRIVGLSDFQKHFDKILADYAGTADHGEPIHEREGQGPVEGIVPIAQGCAGHCSYCIAKLARGELLSYSVQSVVDHIKKELSKGAKEVRLTALDTASYGRDMNTDLSKLVSRVCHIEGGFRIRVGMSNPDTMKPIVDKLIGAYRDRKVYKFFHLPVQSGNNEVLERMNRGYTVDDFLGIVGAFRDEFKDLMLSTDIIIGFPGESDKEFEDSFKLVESLKPDIVNITRFSARPGTKAERMKNQIHGRIMKERSRRLNSLMTKISRKNSEGFVGTEEEVLTVEYGKKGATVGRTNAYRPVVVFQKLPLGKFLNVRIIDNGETYLIGETI